MMLTLRLADSISTSKVECTPHIRHQLLVLSHRRFDSNPMSTQILKFEQNKAEMQRIMVSR